MSSRSEAAGELDPEYFYAESAVDAAAGTADDPGTASGTNADASLQLHIADLTSLLPPQEHEAYRQLAYADGSSFVGCVRFADVPTLPARSRFQTHDEYDPNWKHPLHDGLKVVACRGRTGADLRSLLPRMQFIRHGPGTYHFPNGDRWTGTFLASWMHGPGEHTHCSGTTLAGTWALGELATAWDADPPRTADAVTITYANGDVYVGRLGLDGRYLDDDGTYTHRNGTVYAGGWRDGVYDGAGELNVGGGRYVLRGLFRAGLAQGDDMYERGTDFEYRGMMRDGLRHGHGHMRWLDDNTEFVGEFEHGDPRQDNLPSLDDMSSSPDPSTDGTVMFRQGGVLVPIVDKRFAYLMPQMRRTDGDCRLPAGGRSEAAAWASGAVANVRMPKIRRRRLLLPGTAATGSSAKK